MNLVLLGAPGAGKGTQAVKLAERYGIPHISTGDIFRKNIGEMTPIGVIAKSYIDKGQLVPDEVVVELVAQRLRESDARSGYLLDGFPRTLAQARALDEIATLSTVINVDVELGALAERLTGRRVCEKCKRSFHVSTMESELCPDCGGRLIQRDDDKLETVNARLKVYTSSTAPLIEYYENQGKLITVDGMKSIDEVFAQISEALDRQ